MNISERKIKRFHQERKQITFAYGADSKATTLLIMIQSPEAPPVNLALDQWQTNELTNWLESLRKKEG